MSPIPFRRFGLALGILLAGAGAALAQYGAKKQPPQPLPPGRTRADVKGGRTAAFLSSNEQQPHFGQPAGNAKKTAVRGEGMPPSCSRECSCVSTSRWTSKATARRI